MDKVLVAMSGGVDSSVACALLLKAGYEVSGATMLISDHMQKAVEDARAVAQKLGIEHMVFDYRERFREKVEGYFVDSYMSGITPNPCVKCNKEIKFGQLLDDARMKGFDRLATGHYVRTGFDAVIGKHVIYRDTGNPGDQSYFLCRLSQAQLRYILTPLAGMKKPQVREIASGLGLAVADKKDSQEICFIENDGYREYLPERKGASFKSGDFVDVSGKTLGRHKGIAFYTPGQRKGLGISAGRPLYVLTICAGSNRVVLGEEKDCWSETVEVSDISLAYADSIQDGMRVECKLRSAMKPAWAAIYITKDGLRLVFDDPVWAPAPGQSAVFYDGDRLYGAGTIIGSGDESLC